MKKKIEKPGDAATDQKRGGGRGKYYVCGSEEDFAHKECDLCKSLEHRTLDCEQRGAKKGVMLAKLNVPANSELGPMAVMVGAAHRGIKKEWESDSGAGFHIYVPRPRQNNSIQARVAEDDGRGR